MHTRSGIDILLRVFCDPSACPAVTYPECRQDQILAQVRQEDSCCFSYICVCESCREPAPICTDKEILTVDLNTTNQCCPQYICVCDEKLCTSPQLTCPPEFQLVKKMSDGNCCPDWYCECSCGNDTLMECGLGEFRRLDTIQHSPCGCNIYICEKEEVCVYQGMTVLHPGQSLIEYLNGETCYTVKCLHEKDPVTGFYAVETLTVNCSKNCASVGDSWISNCTKYECTKTAVGAMIRVSSVVCPPFNSSECLKNGGTIQTYNDGCCKI
ncbi:otogelin-like protein, partial [Dendropsophus ebraccatus]|uniref:otogelin-like protein n=1 Tax=Dendropsophus ebraccatus TaxID=150705 RepID=UPI00383197A0